MISLKIQDLSITMKLLNKLLYKIIKELININTDTLEYKIELSRLLLTALDIIKDIIE